MGRGTVREFVGGKEKKKVSLLLCVGKRKRFLVPFFSEDKFCFFFLFTDERGREKREFWVTE